jgi:uncharacterized RDD family membrane protein YckC
VTSAARRARAVAVVGHRAGLLSRLMADAVDLVIVWVLLVCLYAGFAVFRYMITGSSPNLPRTGALYSSVWFVALGVVYLTSTWYLSGRSPGKALLGLRVVGDRGTSMGFLQTLGRAIACMLFGAPSLLWAAVSRKNAAVHDVVFRTAVVHDWPNVVKPAPPEVAQPALEEAR